MRLRDALALGRVSNLPTVWTNVLAALTLTGAVPTAETVLLLLLGLSLFYIGGMYLNDAFDAAIDAVERPDRPIPAGRVRRSLVFTIGFGLLLLGIVLVMIAATTSVAASAGRALASGIGLAGFVVLYNAWHKDNPISPVLMGLCRVFVYLSVAFSVVLIPSAALWTGAVLLLCYLIGLTYAAKQENLNQVANLWPLLLLGVPLLAGCWWTASQPSAAAVYWLLLLVWVLLAVWRLSRRAPGDVPRAVVSLIAGICLLDAALVATNGYPLYALLGLAGFALTLFLQRYIAGT